jgi:hypothetical protein
MMHTITAKTFLQNFPQVTSWLEKLNKFLNVLLRLRSHWFRLRLTHDVASQQDEHYCSSQTRDLILQKTFRIQSLFSFCACSGIPEVASSIHPR